MDVEDRRAIERAGNDFCPVTLDETRKRNGGKHPGHPEMEPVSLVLLCPDASPCGFRVRQARRGWRVERYAVHVCCKHDVQAVALPESSVKFRERNVKEQTTRYRLGDLV